MGNELVNKIREIKPLAKRGVLLLLAFLVSFACISGPRVADAAISVLQAFPATNSTSGTTPGYYKAVAFPGATSIAAIAASAGSDRVLIVAVSSALSAAATQTCTATYNSVSMTQAIGDGTSSARQHTYLFYLPLGTSATAGTAYRPVVTLTGGTATYTTVTTAVYAGVDQTTVTRTPRNYNGGTSTTTTIGPFATGLTINNGDRAVEIVMLYRTNSTTPRTILTYATGWSNQVGPYSGSGTAGVNTYILSDTTAATTTSQHASSGTSVKSMSAISLIPTGVTVATSSNVASQTVYAGNGGKVVDAFTMSGSGSVTGITITGNANTTTGNISAVKIYRKGTGNTNLTALEVGDVPIGTGTASTTTTTISVNETVSALTNYLVVYDIATSAVANGTGVTLGGYVSALTPAAATIADSNTPAAPLTLRANTYVGTGTENPASSRLWRSSSPTNLDAFTLYHNGGTADNETAIINISVTLTPAYISGGTGGTSSKFKLLEITDAGGTVLGSLNKATSGDVWNIPVSGITVTSSPATYYVRATTADAINPSINDTSGTLSGFYPDPAIQAAITGLVTGVTGAVNPVLISDNASSAMTIDVEKPSSPATATASTGTNPGEINLVWDASLDPHSGTLSGTPYKIVRSLPNGAVPNAGCVDGTDISTAGATINYTNRTATDTGLVQTQATNYKYRICAIDAQGNVSDGTTASADAKVLDVCYKLPIITISPTSQLIKSVNTNPFSLVVTNTDQGTCPNTNFTISLTDESATTGDFDKVITINGTDYPFPATVTLGTGGTGAPTGANMGIKITGKPQASQLEQYSFTVTVTNPTHNGNPPSGGNFTYKTASVTGLLNDMPPIVHNANNMGKKQYAINDVDWGATYTCATCHSNSTTNIKGIYQLISTPIGRRPVTFTLTSSTPDVSTGVYGNDLRTVKNVSSNVCEVCHHRTRQHQYSANKPFGGPGNIDNYNPDHHNSRDCVACHTHNTAFRSIYGLCGDCHGFKGTGYSPVDSGTMVRDPLTNALGPAPPNYGAHQRHNKAQISCAACHSNTNHGLLTSTWSGDSKLEMGFTINKDTFQGFNPTASFIGGIFNGTSRLNSPYVWTNGPNTTINSIDNYNNSCSTYCHGGWSGNAGAKTDPFWVGDGVEVQCGNCHYATGTAPPVSGSHQKHAMTTGVGLGIACAKCHYTYAYTNFTGSAHINGYVEWKFDPTDSVTQGALYKPDGAASGQAAGTTGNPAPSAAYGTCSQLYCHSSVQNATDGSNTGIAYATPKWGDPTTATCGSCHAANPNTSGSHLNHENATVGFDCHVCHDNGGTTTSVNHANGRINFRFTGLGQHTRYEGMTTGTAIPGNGYGQCSSSDCHGRSVRTWGTTATALPLCDKCHGSATSAGGFYNTRGPGSSALTNVSGVGVHDIHIQNANSPRKSTFARFTSYAAGYSCNQCHTVPTGPFSAGHIDTALPAEVPFANKSSIAAKGKAFGYYSTPTYDTASRTCSSVYCHGAGMNSNRGYGAYSGLSRRNVARPNWNKPYLTGNAASDCTSCHAYPPPAPNSNYMHFGQTSATCGDCHMHVNADGTSFNDKSKHADGIIEGGCQNCHGNPPITNDVSDKSRSDNTGLANPAQNALNGGAGAHNAHMLLPQFAGGTALTRCNQCHNGYTLKPMGNDKLEIGFNALNGLVTSGTFTGYTNSVNGPKWSTTNSPGTSLVKSNVKAAVCSNLYCHGGGIWNGTAYTLNPLGGGNNTAPNWEVPGDGACGSCHGIDSANAPTNGSHPRHATQIPSIVCADCHGATADNGTHVNGAVSWHLNTTNPLYGTNATYNGMSSGSISGLAPRNNGSDYRTCSGVYCHSNVQSSNGTAGPSSYKTPRWGTDNNTMTCGSCHQDMATDLAPTGSHLKHANTTGSGMGISCGYCHQDAGFGYALHTDGSVYINFTSYIQLAPNSYSAGTALATGMNKQSGTAAYGNCSNTFCHGIAASPNWGTPGPLACNKCHSAKVDDVSWSGRHKTHYNYSTMPTAYNMITQDLSNVNKYRFNCANCHDANVANHSLKPNGVNSAARVFFDISSATPATSSRRGTYSYGGTTIGATDNGFKFTAGSCNNIYCHSNGRGGLPNKTFLNWTTRPTAGSNCLFCHDGKSPNSTPSALSGKHDKHMNPLATNSILGTGNGFNCVDCHAKTVGTTNNLLVTDKRSHVNRMVDYSGVKANKGLNLTTANGECTNVYCHSNGNPNAIAFVSMTGSKNWNGSTYSITTCNKCHGRTTTIGYPDYTNGGVSSATSNLHQGHLAGMTDTTSCSDCHRRTADPSLANKFRPYSSLHLSGGPNIAFNTAKTYVGTKAAVTVGGTNNWTVTCSNVVCHGQGQPVWGGKKSANSGGAGVRTCTKCHGTTTTADYLTNYSSAMIAPGYNGEGTDTSMVNNAATSPRVGAHNRHLNNNAISAPVKCGECHVVVTSMRSGNHWNYSTATLTFTGLRATTNHTPSVSRTAGIMQCSNVNCHSGKYNSGTTIAPFWNSTSVVKETGTTVGDCTKCHAMPPTGYVNHPATLNNLSSMKNIYNRCNICHNNISASGTNVGNIFVDKTKHVNGIMEVSAPCNGCHDYDTNGGTWGNVTGKNFGGTAAVEGRGAHYKHIEYLKTRYNVTLNATTDTFGSGASAAVCGVCHTITAGEHDMSQTVNVRQITFGGGGHQFGSSTPLYNGNSATSSLVNPKSCSNTDCHFKTSPIWSTY